MGSYKAPLEDYRFLMHELFDYTDIAPRIGHPDLDAELLDAMGRDKKAIDGLTFALDGPDGVEVVAGVQESLVEQVLACAR